MPGHDDLFLVNPSGRTVVEECCNGLAFYTAGGDRIDGALGDADIVFLHNHGVMVVAGNIAQAWDDLYYLERVCGAQRLALSTGRPLLPVDPMIAMRSSRQMNRSVARVRDGTWGVSSGS